MSRKIAWMETSQIAINVEQFFLDSMGCSFMSLLLYANQHALNLDTLEEQHLRKAKKKKQDDQDDGEEEEDEVKTLPVLGLGCFAYMLLVEGYETNRMPSIYRYEINLL